MQLFIAFAVGVTSIYRRLQNKSAIMTHENDTNMLLTPKAILAKAIGYKLQNFLLKPASTNSLQQHAIVASERSAPARSRAYQMIYVFIITVLSNSWLGCTCVLVCVPLHARSCLL